MADALASRASPGQPGESRDALFIRLTLRPYCNVPWQRFPFGVVGAIMSVRYFPMTDAQIQAKATIAAALIQSRSVDAEALGSLNKDISNHS
jgi:hypothetical protein